MLVVVISSKKGHAVAVVEKPNRMSVDAVALAWAKGNGYSEFPKDAMYSSEITLTTFGDVALNIMPISDIEKLEKDAFG